MFVAVGTLNDNSFFYTKYHLTSWTVRGFADVGFH